MKKSELEKIEILAAIGLTMVIVGASLEALCAILKILIGL